MSPEQSRAARGWLGWSQKELATRSAIALNTVYEFESKRRTPTAANVAAMQRVIEGAGITLLFDREGAPAGIARGDAEIAPAASPVRRE